MNIFKNKITLLPEEYNKLVKLISKNEKDAVFLRGKDENGLELYALTNKQKKTAFFRYYPDDNELFTDMSKEQINAMLYRNKYLKFLH